jgi:acylphosphatase
MSCRRFVVSGRVQGVGFRWIVLQHARRLELRGFARNCADGSVEVVVTGRDAALAELERHLRQGPDIADVTGVHADDEATDPGLTSFEIRRT